MARPPTPKKVRKHMQTIMRRWYALQKALDAAHNDEVIVYPSDKYTEQGPCWASFELKDRIYKTTEKQRAEAFMQEIKDDYY
jgi:hypothetical protein